MIEYSRGRLSVDDDGATIATATNVPINPKYFMLVIEFPRKLLAGRRNYTH